MNNPTGLAFDISTVAGTGVPGFSGDGGPATGATLFGPGQVTVDGAGNILIDDTNNGRIRRVDAGTAVLPGPGECRGVVTQNIKLQRDIGPCPAGTDGMVVGADNVKVDLNGHTVAGPGPGKDDGSHAGIRLTGRRGVTATGGKVTGFDVGVALIGSSNNTISNLTVRTTSPRSSPRTGSRGRNSATASCSCSRVATRSTATRSTPTACSTASACWVSARNTTRSPTTP